MVKRTLVVKIPPEAMRDLDRFLQRVSSVLKVPEASFRVERGGVLRVEVKGPRAEIREAMARVRSVVSEFTVIDAGGSKIYNVKWIASVAGGPVPLDVLVEALKAKGYTASATGESLETRAPRETVVELASLVREAYESLKEPLYSRAFRKAIALAHALTGKPVSKLIDVAEQRGHVIWRGDKAFIKGSWKTVARDLSKPGLNEHLSGNS